jgi:predicted O-methyltransferase YrrM
MSDGSIVHEANAARSVDPARELDAILSVFAALGFPREVVTQWSLPSSDVADLVRLAADSGARRVLEVGSFVGTSAFLMARALPEAEIHSVDPNLPLDVEFTAMGSADRGADLARRTLEIARESARRLALDGRVRFHEGGFAVGATFALSDVAIPVVGPDLCARQGPFDFAFIDGLHFEDAVEADIALTLAHMTPDGVVALHDADEVVGRVPRVLDDHRRARVDAREHRRSDVGEDPALVGGALIRDEAVDGLLDAHAMASRAEAAVTGSRARRRRIRSSMGG